MLDKILTLTEDIILKGKIFIPRKAIQITAYYILPLGLLCFYLAISRHNQYQSDLGSIAYGLLLITLFIKPIHLIIKPIGLFKTIGSYRRELGLATFYFALFHFLFYAKMIRLSPINLLPKVLTSITPMFYGAWALIILFVLAITSNKISTMALKRNWKKLHSLVYIAMPLILIHIAYMKGEGYISAILITLLYIGLKYKQNKITKQKNRLTINP